MIKEYLKEEENFDNLFKILAALGIGDNSIKEYFIARGENVSKKLINISEFREDSSLESVDVSILENQISTIMFDPFFNRIDQITYRKSKEIIKNNGNIVDKKTYDKFCGTLPKDPEDFFKEKFIGWIDYLGIKRVYYTLEECRNKVKQYLLENIDLKPDPFNIYYIMEKIHKTDKLFPSPCLLVEYYGLKKIEDIIKTNIHKKTSGLNL